MNRQILLPYYPYGLRSICLKKPSESFLIKELNEAYYEALDWWERPFQIPYHSPEFRIVLHALEDIYRPLKVNNREVVASDVICRIVWENTQALKDESDPSWIVETVVNYFNNASFCPFPRDIMNQLYYLLHALHFDLSGFIGRNEAVRASKLKVDPYEFDKIVL